MLVLTFIPVIFVCVLSPLLPSKDFPRVWEAMDILADMVPDI